MNASPIHIKVNRTERELFETAAKMSGVTMTELIKNAVLAYVQKPLPKDEFAEALSRLKTFAPSEAQLAQHREALKRRQRGDEGPGLSPAESLALLKKRRKGQS